jgi:hypothetical protein
LLDSIFSLSWHLKTRRRRRNVKMLYFSISKQEEKWSCYNLPSQNSWKEEEVVLVTIEKKKCCLLSRGWCWIWRSISSSKATQHILKWACFKFYFSFLLIILLGSGNIQLLYRCTTTFC